MKKFLVYNDSEGNSWYCKSSHSAKRFFSNRGEGRYTAIFAGEEYVSERRLFEGFVKVDRGVYKRRVE